MKRKSLLALFTCLPLMAQADLFISEYIEGSGFNKAIELYNPSKTAVNLANYQIKLYQNGGDTAKYAINLSGSIEPNAAFVIAHADLDASVTIDLVTTSLLHNGDDAIVLTYNDQVVDSIGRIGQDPGSEWGSGLASTKDNSLVRLASISSGDTDASDHFEPSEQWQGFAKNTFTNLGSHTYSGEDSGGSGGSGGDNTDPLSACSMPFTSIHDIQGISNISPLLGDVIWSEGIVTANFQESGYKGFFLQSADNEKDLIAESSEGIFVYHDSTPVQVGDRVRFSATVAEYYEQTQLTIVNQLSICASGLPLPSKTTASLPLSQPDELESYEGMLINFPQTLYVTDTYNYGRYGQLGLASERLFNPTQIATPGAAAQAVAQSNALKMIVLDDADTVQNPEVLPFPSPELSALNTIRSGDSVTKLTAVLSFSFGHYQLLPTASINFTTSNVRSNAPAFEQQGNLRIASFNVLNYFNGDGTGNGYPTARGAKTAEEFSRQREKVIAAISQLQADIIGLMEIENDGFGTQSALTDLVTGLNEAYGQNVYQFIEPNTATIGSDAIAVGLIYRVDKVSPQGIAKILDSSNSSKDTLNQVLFLDNKNRPMLTQQFSLLANEQSLVVAVNHLKSKGSACDSLGDFDENDGQGNCNITRTRAAQAIGEFLTQHYPEQASLIIGDLNAYAKEDPLTVLSSQGYHNIFAGLNKTASYSYIYKGELGQLDHALANDKLMSQIIDINTWAINADEPRVLDYSTQYQNAGQQAKFYAPDAYRSSDHDPVIIEINLQSSAVFGDFDNDKDIDKNDVSAFYQQIQNGQLTDMSYDFNGDGTLSRADTRGLMKLCTRSRCAIK
mgnify:CR=1 FL=1